MKKKCSKCNLEHELSHFNKKASNKDGLQKQCKDCLKKFHKEHYKQNTQYYKDKALKHNAEYRVRNLEFMINYLLNHPCIDCKEINPALLEFDHRSDKSYDVSAMSTLSLETLASEIAKCDVRCSLCHRQKTAKQLGYYKNIRIPIMDLITNIQSLIKELKNIEAKEDLPRFYFNNYWHPTYAQIKQEFAKAGLQINVFVNDFFLHKSNDIIFEVVEIDEYKKYENRDKVNFTYSWKGTEFKNMDSDVSISFDDIDDAQKSAADIGLAIKEALVKDITKVLSDQVKQRVGNSSHKLKFAKIFGKHSY